MEDNNNLIFSLNNIKLEEINKKKTLIIVIFEK